MALRQHLAREKLQHVEREKLHHVALKREPDPDLNPVTSLELEL